MKKLSGIGIVAIFLVAFAISVYGSESGLFAIAGVPQAVYLPNFASAECAVVLPNQEFPNSDGQYLNTGNTKAYGAYDRYLIVQKVAHSPQHTAEYRVDSFVTHARVWKTSATTDVATELKNGKKFEDFATKLADKSFSSDAWLNAGTYSPSTDKIIFEVLDGSGAIEGNEFRYRIKADVYGLKSRSASGFFTIATGTCSVDAIGKDVLREDIVEAGLATSRVVPFGKAINYVESSSPAISGNVITRNGQQIYVYAIGKYYLIKPADDGTLYADSSQSLDAPEIICMPASPYCSDDGRSVISPDSPENKCNSFFGSTAGYLPSDKPNEVCTYSCVNGQLAKNSCKAVPTCASGQALDANYNCVSLGTSTPTSILTEKNKFILIATLLIGGLAIIGLLAYQKWRKK